ncbi:unnamed protein product [Mesocestoides corti]|uniref:Uncharacterized protein n=2 Tax=Mesocestoides corti TaxID=53468 RepID=A0A0R3UAQ2_MESCO|nr:unnamed protein product [Mesocestoides corti]
MENLLQELQKSFERRRQITFDNSNIKAQITEKVGQLSRIIESTSTTDSKSKHQFSGQSPVVTELKDTIENLKTRLRESERRCALESLRYEELLLELESSQMRQKYDMLDDASSGFGAHSLLMAASTSPRDALNDLSDELHSRIGERMNQGWDLTNFGKFRGDEEWASPTKGESMGFGFVSAWDIICHDSPVLKCYIV